MAIIPIPILVEGHKVKFTRDGIYMWDDSSGITVYCGVIVFIWLPLLFFFPSVLPSQPYVLPVLLSAFSAILFGYLLTKFVLIKLNFVQKALHPRRLILWETVENAEMKNTRVRFILKKAPNVAYGQERILVDVHQGYEIEARKFLESVLGEKFSVKEHFTIT